MDFSQLLSSGFQFLNLEGACEAEVEILTDMLFKQQDEKQLSKLFHLKTYPDGDSYYGKYFTCLQDGHPGVHGEHGVEVGPGPDCHAINDEHEQGPIVEQLQETGVIVTEASIPIANGPLVPMSPQHHVINVDPSPGDCGASGEMIQPMIPTMPPPIRSYYTQQQVSVVHGSPQAQVGSPGVGQPQHGQVGVVSPAYTHSHVQVPISMHQQQLIMMPAQPQAGQQYVGMPPVHFVAPQRHHGHPPHNYVQGGPNKYSNGPRKPHSNRNRRNESDMMNNYPQAYYQGIYTPGMVPAYNHGYNLQQQFAHTVTGSPIIMQPSHHGKGPVTMYATHQYSSPPPTVQTPVTPHTSSPETQQQQQQIPVTLSDSSLVGSQQQQQQQPSQQHHVVRTPPPTSSPSAPPLTSSSHEKSDESERETLPNSVQVHSCEGGAEVPSQLPVDSKSVVNEAGEPQGGAVESHRFVMHEVRSSSSSCVTATPTTTTTPGSQMEVQDAHGAEMIPHSRVSVPPQPYYEDEKSSSSGARPAVVNHEAVVAQVKGQSSASPVPDQIQDNVVTNKCSSPLSTTTTTTKEMRVPSTPASAATGPSPPAAAAPPPSAQGQVVRPQTWAETSAARPHRTNSASSTNNNPSSISNSVSASSSSSAVSAGVFSAAGGGDDKTLKDKQGQINSSSSSNNSTNKSSTEFPALGGKPNVNGTAPNSNSSVSSVSGAGGGGGCGGGGGSGGQPVHTATPAPHSQKSWASVVCRQKNSSSPSSLPPPSSSSSQPTNNGNSHGSGGGGGQQVSAGGSNSSSSSSSTNIAPHLVTPHDSDGSVSTASSTTVTTAGGIPAATAGAGGDRHGNHPIPVASSSVGDNNGHAFVPMQTQCSEKSSLCKISASSSSSLAQADPPFDPSCLNNESDSLALRLGEFLANYTLDHHATALTPRGLTNQSNFCYINATLQALMACPPFVNLFRSLKDVGLAKTPCKATPIIQSVFDFVSEFEPLNRGNTNKRDRRNDSSFITGANLEPSGIRKVLGLLDGSTFKVEGRQQDAEEFLSHLLNGLHDEMIKVIKWYENSKSVGTSSAATPGGIVNGQHPEVVSEDDGDADNWQVMGPRNKGCVTRKTNIIKSPISEMLFGQLCSALQRTNERNNVRNLQPFFTLQLDIQNDNIKSIRDALEGLSMKEEVIGLVSNSGQETTAWRQLSLEELPMILILHLKRFVYDKSGHKIQKLDKKLEFGIDLEIGKDLLSVNTRSKWTLKQRTYKLFAVVYHDGEEAYKGHYVADCFHPSGGNIWGQVGWLRYDDITVKPISDSAMLNSQPPRVPYLLYYRRADTLVSHHHVQAARNKDRPRIYGASDS